MSFADFFADIAAGPATDTQPLLDADFDTIADPDQFGVGLHELLDVSHAPEWL